MNESKQFMKRVGMTVVGVLVCGVSVGFFKCSMFGLGTFINLFLLGYVIDYFNRTLAQPFLYGKKK